MASRNILYELRSSLANRPVAVASEVETDDVSLSGVLSGATTVQEVANRLDGTGLGANIIEFSGDLEADSDLDQWFQNRQIVQLETSSAQTDDALLTFTLPNLNNLGLAFDELALLNLTESLTLVITHSAGQSVSVINNVLTITPSLNNSASFNNSDLPIRLALGESATLRITRDSEGVISGWKLISLATVASGTAAYGDLSIQNQHWVNATGATLPDTASQGDLFLVEGSSPNDGTLRTDLASSITTGRYIYDGDYVAWLSDSFTSWSNGDDWAVFGLNEVQRLSASSGRFLAQVSETDFRRNVARVNTLTTSAVSWLDESTFTSPPSLTPSTDADNPRQDSDYRYVGGNENQGPNGDFRLNRNAFSTFLTIGITREFLDTHSLSDVFITMTDDGGDQLFSYSLADDFTEQVDPAFTGGDLRYFSRSQSINYPSLATIAIYLTSVQRTFALNSTTVDVTGNVSDLAENQLASDLQTKINDATTMTGGGDRVMIDPALTAKINVEHEYEEPNARFLSAGETDPYPNDLTGFNQVTQLNPCFSSTDVVLYVAVPEPGNYSLRNTTQRLDIPLEDSSTVSVISSVTEGGVTYFIYRVTGINSGNVFEVEQLITENKLVIINRLDNLTVAVQELEAQQEEIPNDLLEVFENETVVTIQDDVSLVPSAFNFSLGRPDRAAIFQGGESFDSSIASPFIASDAINGSAIRHHILYHSGLDSLATGVFVSARNPDTGGLTALITYRSSEMSLYSSVYVPARPAGEQDVMIYPAPADHISGDNIWQNISTIRIINGVPTANSNELFFTRNLPTVETTVIISYRGHANGVAFGTGIIALDGVGGPNTVSTNFTLTSGSETATVNVAWINNQIRFRVDEHISNGFPTITDVEVIPVFTETRTVPSVPESTREVLLQRNSRSSDYFALAFNRNVDNTLEISSADTTINTRYNYDDLFGPSENGGYTALGGNSQFFRYVGGPNGITPTQAIMSELNSHASGPNFGVFDSQITHATTLGFNTQLTADNSAGDVVNVGQELISVAPNGTRWRVSVDNSGSVITTQVT